MAAMRVAPVQKTAAETIGKTARGKQQSGNQRIFYRLELLFSAISYAILILTSLLTTYDLFEGTQSSHFAAQNGR